MSSTQILFPGWAIITASWADVYSKYFSNDQTLYKLYKKALEEKDIETLSNYGFLYSYGMYLLNISKFKPLPFLIRNSYISNRDSLLFQTQQNS